MFENVKNCVDKVRNLYFYLNICKNLIIINKDWPNI